jgi:hypothetical protein
MKKNYPLFIQTWIPEIGSAILHNQSPDEATQHWACDQLAEWNSLPLQKDEITCRRVQKDNYFLQGILYHGGTEEFGRSFTEIRAILLDQEAVLPEEDELQEILQKYDIEDKTYAVELPIKQVTYVDEEVSVRNSDTGKNWLAVLILSLVAVITFFLYKQEFSESKKQQQNQHGTKTLIVDNNNQVEKNIDTTKKEQVSQEKNNNLKKEIKNTKVQLVNPSQEELNKINLTVYIEGEGTISILSFSNIKYKLQKGNENKIPIGKYKIEVTAEKGWGISKLKGEFYKFILLSFKFQ